MAYRSYGMFAPKQDTGWGLIYRLNLKMGQIETVIERGDLDMWNLYMDRIFVNILYKDPEEVVQDEKTGAIIDVNFSKIDTKVFEMFNLKISKVKQKVAQIHESTEEWEDLEKKHKLMQLRKEYYNILFKKDVWLRKKMFQMHLYMREAESDPRKAIYGG